MSTRDFRILRSLADIAAQGHVDSRARLAAGIVFRRSILAVGLNSYHITHPFQRRYGSNPDAIYFHAETAAIHSALRTYDREVLARSTLYVARVKWDSTERRTLTWGRACPCVGCRGAISDYRIQRVVYSEDGDGQYVSYIPGAIGGEPESISGHTHRASN